MPEGSYGWGSIETIYFDLDGTLLDVSMRYYRLHCDLCQYLNEEPLPFPSFWQLKRQKATIEQILPKAFPEIRAEYTSKWLTLIEAPNYLRYDIILPGTCEVLKELRKKFQLVLATMRWNQVSLEGELLHHGITDLFAQVISRGHINDNRAKWELIREESAFLPTKAIIVGDAEEDIEAGKRLSLGTIAVANGIRTTALLGLMNPDLLIQNLSELLPLLLH